MASARMRRTSATAAMRGSKKGRASAAPTGGGNGIADNKVAKKTGSKEPASTVPGRRKIVKNPAALKRGKGGTSSGKKAGATFTTSAAAKR